MGEVRRRAGLVQRRVGTRGTQVKTDRTGVWDETRRDPKSTLKLQVPDIVSMENDQGIVVELYVPRKCAATNRLITAKDHSSVQINIAEVDEEGKAIPGKNVTYALSGFVRREGEADDSLNRLATQDELLRNVWSGSR